MNDEIFDFTSKVVTVGDSFEKEKEHRVQNTKHKYTTGNTYFDDALGGIYCNDVLLIGAKSGKGKTEFAVNIAEQNAKLGKKVLYFALEAEKFEITRRIKYKYISKYFFKNRLKFQDIPYLRYADWYYGNYGNALELAEKYAEKEMSLFQDNIKIIYRESSKYTVDDFAKTFFSMQADNDLFIVDHIHYFDSDQENENKAMKEIMKKLRDCALIGDKPIVLLAHLRKSDKASKNIMPDLEDFHGSSDLGKIATKAIVMSPSRRKEDYDQENKNRYPTFLKVLKSRVGSDVERYTALGFFDIYKNQYEQFYCVGEDSFDKWEECEEGSNPVWVRTKITKNEFGEIVGFDK
jgi:replicative DNA helicase